MTWGPSVSRPDAEINTELGDRYARYLAMSPIEQALIDETRCLPMAETMRLFALARAGLLPVETNHAGWKRRHDD